jgi:hypothetical protein
MSSRPFDWWAIPEGYSQEEEEQMSDHLEALGYL